MLKKVKKKHIVITSILFGIISLFMFGTIAYSAINSTARITGDAYARVETDVRITDFRLASTNNAFSASTNSPFSHIKLFFEQPTVNNDNAINVIILFFFIPSYSYCTGSLLTQYQFPSLDFSKVCL